MIKGRVDTFTRMLCRNIQFSRIQTVNPPRFQGPIPAWILAMVLKRSVCTPTNQYYIQETKRHTWDTWGYSGIRQGERDKADKTATTIRINRRILTISNEITHSNLSIHCKKWQSLLSVAPVCSIICFWCRGRGKLVCSKFNINLGRRWCLRIVEISWELLFHCAPPAFPAFTGRIVWQPYEATSPAAEAGNRTVLCSSL